MRIFRIPDCAHDFPRREALRINSRDFKSFRQYQINFFTVVQRYIDAAVLIGTVVVVEHIVLAMYADVALVFYVFNCGQAFCRDNARIQNDYNNSQNRKLCSAFSAAFSFEKNYIKEPIYNYYSNQQRGKDYASFTVCKYRFF